MTCCAWWPGRRKACIGVESLHKRARYGLWIADETYVALLSLARCAIDDSRVHNEFSTASAQVQQDLRESNQTLAGDVNVLKARRLPAPNIPMDERPTLSAAEGADMSRGQRRRVGSTTLCAIGKYVGYLRACQALARRGHANLRRLYARLRWPAIDTAWVTGRELEGELIQSIIDVKKAQIMRIVAE